MTVADGLAPSKHQTISNNQTDSYVFKNYINAILLAGSLNTQCSRDVREPVVSLLYTGSSSQRDNAQCWDIG